MYNKKNLLTARGNKLFRECKLNKLTRGNTSR